MEQGSEKWHEFRLGGIGSSDAPVIMGVSPYRTPFQLWEEKTGREPRDESSNWAMRRGNNLEPVARAQYELTHSIEMPPTLVQHERYPFLRASLDGFNKDTKTILEIKCPGKDDHELAKQGKIPTKYTPQLNHQLLVTGADRVHYFSFDGSSGVLVEHCPDVESIKELFSAELDFWKCVETDTPPRLTDKDYKKIKNPELSAFIKKWKAVKKKLDKLEPEESALKKEIIQRCEHPRMSGVGVQIQKIYRKGSVDYSTIPELQNIDLEKFRKKSSESWRLDLI